MDSTVELKESGASDDSSSSDIAIIGLAGRFPGAGDVEEFWQNLERGVESVQFFSDEELKASGVPAAQLNDPNYVKARAILEGAEWFDAEFYGFSPRDAEILDPQHRLFLECAWEAIESAGYDSSRYEGRVGVYAGASLSTYLLNLYSNRALIESVSPFDILIANDKDFLTTRVSYKLNLVGPSIAVQTACSTSLIAVHLACQSLLNGECEMALAGGVSIRVPQKTGHLYQRGSIMSPDGHCRAFDARAEGAVSGDGLAVVFLKRLEDALADGDCIHAVIKGTASNNDGSMKAGFTAPSVSGQASVIAEAQAMAGVDAASISYVETHGTGTALGDPIEIAALTKAFRASQKHKASCAIGSVKTNIGHLDAAAGVVGLVKVILSMRQKQLPPSLNFERPNPKINFADGPFYVNTKLSEWEGCSMPRRAGVSSFGIGGTNAHVIVEEAPAVRSGSQSRPWQLITLSARTDTALEALTSNLAAHFKRHPMINIADVAYTLQVGRKEFDYRRIAVCRDLQDSLEVLEGAYPHRVLTSLQDAQDRPVVFMFPGQGSQYVGMAHELYQVEPDFRRDIDLCCDLIEPHLGQDLRRVIYAAGEDQETAAQLLNQTDMTQAALFVVEYAVARLWMRWGVRPKAMIGHSIGEYVAACLAEVFSIEDALVLVAARGKLMQGLPAGAMLAVSLQEGEVLDMLDEHLSLAAVNGTSTCVVSGPVGVVDALENRLHRGGAGVRRLNASRAFHSQMCDPILEPFIEQVKKVDLQRPKIPYISSVSGTWIKASEANDPDYWARHLRQTVRFGDGLQEISKGYDGVLLEVGPGNILNMLARQNQRESVVETLASLRRPHNSESDLAFLLGTLGKLWLAGVKIDWAGFYAQERRLRTSLPTYPFERERYWIEPSPQAVGVNDVEQGDKARVSRSMHRRPKLANPYVAATSEVEMALCNIWQELLGLERVGIHDDFFSLGGHSLMATQLLSRTCEAFEVDLPLQRLFEASTIAALAIEIEDLLVEKLEGLSDEEAENLLERANGAM